MPPDLLGASANESPSSEHLRAARRHRLWGRLAVLLLRFTQSLVDPTEVRLVCYVDDPLAAISGTDEERWMLAALMIMVWVALGFKYAFAKDQLGKQATWIGGALWIEPQGVRAFIKQSIIDDIQETLIHFLPINVVAKSELRSLIGKLSHAAGLLIVMRPFMDPL